MTVLLIRFDYVVQCMMINWLSVSLINISNLNMLLLGIILAREKLSSRLNVQGNY